MTPKKTWQNVARHAEISHAPCASLRPLLRLQCQSLHPCQVLWTCLGEQLVGDEAPAYHMRLAVIEGTMPLWWQRQWLLLLQSGDAGGIAVAEPARQYHLVLQLEVVVGSSRCRSSSTERTMQSPMTYPQHLSPAVYGSFPRTASSQ